MGPATHSSLLTAGRRNSSFIYKDKTMTDFSKAHPALAKALVDKGYKALTQVQDAVLAPELVSVDMLVSAQTGSGKTVAFGLALASTLLEDQDQLPRADMPMAVVIAPTRELAMQVKRELDWLYSKAGGQVASCVGGMDMRDERRALGRGAHIVVGTPGRLCDHIKRGSLDMSELKAVILDEADEMLKMGFREEVELILSAAPDNRRSLMFSATVPKTIAALAKKYQRGAVRVNTAAEAKQHLDIEYRALKVAKDDRENAIINVLRYYDAKNAIVFCDRRDEVNRMVQRFNNRGFSVVALSGELNQNQRSAALQALRDGRAKVCIATDVAARGLDLPDLELVIHASIPKNTEALLHRSGRTGRAGRKGVSVLIVQPFKGVRRAERLLKGAKITANWVSPPSVEDVLAKDNERMMGDLVLEDPVTDDERVMAERMLEIYEPGQIAAAFIRQYRAGRSAPEELVSGDNFERGGPRERKPRNDFEGGIWFTLNLGRKQNAEPRWILPMLCKSGDLKKGEIGSIKITETSTFVEVDPAGLERFLNAIGPDGKIEKAITARQVEGRPDFKDGHVQGGGKDRGRRRGKGRERSETRDRKSKPYAPREKLKSYDDRPKKMNKKAKARAAAAESKDDYQEATVWSDDPSYVDKPKAKKPHKKKLARAAAKVGKKAGKSGGKKPSQNRGGDAPPKRRTKTSGKSKGGAKLKRKPRK